METEITLTWCKKHKNWWVTNCPDCMVDANEESIKQAGMKEVVEWVKAHLHKSPECSYDYCFPNRVWKAQLQKWGIE